MSRNFKKINIVALDDTHISYVTLAKDNQGFFIDSFESAELEEGIIKNGEILKASFLQKILKKIKKQIKTDRIHLLLAHDVFSFDHMSFQKAPRKHLTKQIKEFLKKEKSNIPWAASHDFEYDSIQEGEMVNLSFRMLPRTLHKVYSLVFSRAGFYLESIHSDAAVFGALIPKKGRTTDIFFREKETLLLEYRDGVYLSSKSFELSYEKLQSDIDKALSLGEEQALQILKEYGVQKNHREPKVLSLINRSLSPLFEFIKKRKVKEELQFSVHFSDFRVKGFYERVRLTTADPVTMFDIHELPDVSFHEVLSLEKKYLNKYLPLVVRAVALAQSSHK